MFRSRAVAKWNPSSSCNTMLIFWIIKGFLTNLLLASWKLLKRHMVWIFLGWIKNGAAHWGHAAPPIPLIPLAIVLLSWVSSCVSLAWGKLNHGMVLPLLSTGRIPALFSSHPWYCQIASQIAGEVAVTIVFVQHLGDCNVFPWLPGCLFFHS